MQSVKNCEKKNKSKKNSQKVQEITEIKLEGKPT